MSEIKDKIIGIFAVVPGRDFLDCELKVKRYIHDRNRLRAYVRGLSQREKFAAKAVGAELSTIFKINYNEKIRTGLYLEFRGETYVIASVDGFEFYRRDLTIRANRCKTEVFDYEEYDQ